MLQNLQIRLESAFAQRNAFWKHLAKHENLDFGVLQKTEGITLLINQCLTFLLIITSEGWIIYLSFACLENII